MYSYTLLELYFDSNCVHQFLSYNYYNLHSLKLIKLVCQSRLIKYMKKYICFVLSSWIEITTSEQWPLILILDYTNKFHQNKDKIIPYLYSKAATGKSFIRLPNYVLIPEFITEVGGWGNGIDTLMECLLEECPTKWRSPINRWWYYTCRDVRGKVLGKQWRLCLVKWLNFFISKPIFYLHTVRQERRLSTTTINDWNSGLP